MPPSSPPWPPSKRARYYHQDDTPDDRKPVIDQYGEPVYRNGQPLYRNNGILVEHFPNHSALVDRWKAPGGPYAAPLAEHRASPVAADVAAHRSAPPTEPRAARHTTFFTEPQLSQAATPATPAPAPRLVPPVASYTQPAATRLTEPGNARHSASFNSTPNQIAENSNPIVIDDDVPDAKPSRPPPFDHNKHPEVMERILLNLPFMTLLAFRGTNSMFNKKITDSFQKLVVEEVHNGDHWEIQLRTAAGYRLSEYPSSSCLFKKHRHVELPKNTGIIRFIRKYGSRYGRGVIEVRGPININYFSGPHFLGHIVQYLAKCDIRYVPSKRGFTTNVTGKGEVLLVNDSAGYPRDINTFDSLKTAIYRFDGSETEHLLRTRVKGVEKVVYDFTQWSKSNVGLNTATAVDESNLRLFNLVDHIVTSISLESEVVVAGLDEVDVHWLNPNWGRGPDGRPLHINQHLPSLVSSQCDLYGIDLEPGTFKMVYRGHESLSPVPHASELQAPPDSPMILIVHKA